MIHVIVSYQVSPGFVEMNKVNIERSLEDFRRLDNTQFSYTILLKDDGTTFVHLSSYENEAIQKEILNTPSFLEFQSKRDEAG